MSITETTNLYEDIHKRVLLEYTKGKSNKFYEVSVVDEIIGPEGATVVLVRARHGRKTKNWEKSGGRTIHKSTEWKNEETIADAINFLDRLIKQKKNKGYKEVYTQKRRAKKFKKIEPRFVNLDI